MPDGLRAEATVTNAGGATTADVIKLLAHATDGDGTISIASLDWGDGTVLHGGRGTACNPPAVAPADCRNFSVGHTYASVGTYTVTLRLISGLESTEPMVMSVTIGPSPTPTATA